MIGRSLLSIRNCRILSCANSTCSLRHFSMSKDIYVSTKAIICPSMLSSDFANLASEAKRMVDSGADWLHMDVMDGHFVPNLTLGAPVIKSLRAHTSAYLDCHLMVSNPEFWVGDFADAGANCFTFHIEATENPDALIDSIAAKGMDVGIAVKPNTPAEAVLKYAADERVRMILVMTVEPGFGGQSFMANMMPKVEAVRKAGHKNLLIQVDGGIGPDNAEVVGKAGANVIVAGTTIFKSSNPPATITKIRELVNANLNF